MKGTLMDERKTRRGKAGKLLNRLSDMAVIVDEKGNFLAVNHVFEDVTGLRNREIVGKSFLQFDSITAETKAILFENLKKRMQGLPIQPYEICFTDRNGITRYAEVRGVRVIYAKQPADLVVFHDVSRKNQDMERLQFHAKNMEDLAKQKMRETVDNEMKLRSITESIRDAVFMFDGRDVISYWNPAAADIFGYAEEEIVGKQVNETLVPPRFRKNHVNLAHQILKAENGFCEGRTWEFPALRKDGTEFLIELSMSPMKLNSEKFIVAIARDITDRKTNEQLLRESEIRYRNIVDNSLDGIMLTMPDGAILSANPKMCEMLGMSEEEIKRAGRSGVIVQDENLLRALKEREQTGQATAELTFKRKNGTTFPAEVSSKLFTDAQGKTKTSMVVRDITERKKAEAALKKSHAQQSFLAQLVRDSSIAIGIGFPDGRLGITNDAYRKLTGYTEDELSKISWSKDLTPPEYRKTEETKLQELQCTKRPVQYQKEYIRKDGTMVPVELVVHPFVDEKGNVTHYYAFVTDITIRRRAEKIVRESEKKYRQLFDTAPCGIAVYRPIDDGSDFIFLDFNKAAEHIEHTRKKDILGKRVTDVFPGVKKFGLLDVFRRVHRSGLAEHIPSRFYRDTRVRGWRENWVYRLPSGNIVAVYNDVSEVKKAEEQLARAAQEWERTFDAISDFVFIVDKDYRITRANKALCTALKKKPSELQGRLCFEIIHGTKQPWLNCPHAKTIATGMSVTEEINDPNLGCPLLVTDSPIFNNEGQLVGTVHIAKNIAERKESEDALRTSEAKYRELINGMTESVWVIGFDGNFLDVNDAAVKVLGYSKEELLSMDIAGIDKHLDSNRVKNLIDRLPTVGTQVFETVHTSKDGNQMPVEISSSIVSYRGEKAILSIARDITERKRSDTKLRESEEKYRLLVENLPQMVIILQDAHIKYANPITTEKLGYTVEELNSFSFDTQKQIERHIPNSHHKLVSEYGERMVTGSKIAPIEISLIKSDGKELPVLCYNQPMTYDGKPAQQWIFTDLTEIRDKEEALRRSERKFRLIFENAPVYCYMVSPKGTFLDINKCALESFGYDKEELVGKSLFTIYAPSSREKAKRLFQKFLETGKIDNEELTIITKKGEERTVLLSVNPFYDNNGNLLHSISVQKDITEQKLLQERIEKYSRDLERTIEERTTELKRANELLLKAERYAAIGELAGMVGHDLRNPLSAIRNAIYYAKKTQANQGNADAKKIFEIIDSSITYADKVINDLLDYSKEPKLEIESCSPRELLERALSTIRIPENIETVNYLANEPFISVDQNKLLRVFINLLKNAIDAMPQGGTLKVKSRQIGDSLEIFFSDTGIGMTKETMSKVFTPLVTTKAQGMGFGLAICKRIVEAHQGRITVDSTEGKGSTFTITLPIECKLEGEGEKAWMTPPTSPLNSVK